MTSHSLTPKVQRWLTRACSRLRFGERLTRTVRRRKSMKRLQSKEAFFTWSDAWVFASLKGSFDETGRFQPASLITIGDMLNHSILSNAEVKQGLAKMAMRGLVEVKEKNIELTTLAKTLYARVEKMRGGLFSVVDNCLKVLNSPRSHLPHVEVNSDLGFIDES